MGRTRSAVAMATALIGVLAVLTACAPDPLPAPTVTTALPAKTPTPTPTPVPVPIVQPTITPSPEPTHAATCAQGSLLAIWAHYDDDLIFGHSRVDEALAEGKCVTIAYLSAGDAGKGVDYSLGREQGIRNAYDTLRAYNGQWTENTDVLLTLYGVLSMRGTERPASFMGRIRLRQGTLWVRGENRLRPGDFGIPLLRSWLLSMNEYVLATFDLALSKQQ